MKKHIIILLFLPCLFAQLHAQKPLSNPQGSWTLLADYSDEFNSTSGLDLNKWDNNINDWGVWSWEPENVWLDGMGFMHIRMTNEQHVRAGKTYYFKSGAARQRKTITYGYFEAKVKGCPTFPGVCPAFWMYSSQQSSNGVTYNEIDFMEIQQRQFNISGIDCNTHYVLSGSSAWIDTKNFYNAPFATNDGFHVYGCNVTRNDITFYIDGVEVAKNNNQYFILPMNVILSMGVRPPFMEYGDNGEKLPIVVVNNTGFPTEMLVDYVRVWIPTATSTIDVSEQIEKLSVIQNSTNNNAKINFTVNKAEFVNITIYDISGRKIKMIVNDFKQAGSYSYLINCSEIARGGIYFCRLNTSSNKITTKFVVD